MKYAVSNDEMLLNIIKQHIQTKQKKVAEIYLNKYINYTQVASERMKEANTGFKDIKPLSEELIIKTRKIDKGELKKEDLTKEEEEELKIISSHILDVSEKISNGEINIYYFDKGELEQMFYLNDTDLKLLSEDIGSLEDVIDGKEEPLQES